MEKNKLTFLGLGHPGEIHTAMKKISLFCLAALLILVPLRSLKADIQTPFLNRGTPTMAYYTKGRVIYYGYTEYQNGVLPYSSILASNPAYARVHYQNATMAYYEKSKVVYYAYTNNLPGRSLGVLDNRFIAQGDQQFTSASPVAGAPPREAISLVRTETGEPARATPPVRMRDMSFPNRETFEQESEQTKGTQAENLAAMLSTPVDAAGFYKRGNAFKENNDFWKAIQDYNEVTRQDPENAFAYYKRGLCYSALNQMDLANQNFRRANELLADPEKPWSQRVRAWYPQSGY